MNDFWKQSIAAHDHVLVLSLLASGLPLDEARDVAQEAWLRVVEAHAAGKLGRLELPGLVIRQASFIVIDRQRARRLRVLAPAHEAEVLPAAESAEHGAAAQELLALVDSQLALASARERRVLRSVVTMPELPHRALAAREGLTVQRFRQVLCDVRARLRRALEGA